MLSSNQCTTRLYDINDVRNIATVQRLKCAKDWEQTND